MPGCLAGIALYWGVISEKKQALEALQQENKEKKESYQQRVETLRDYQNELLTL